MKPKRYVREQKRYTQEELTKIFGLSEEKTVSILKALKEYGILKAVKYSEQQKDLTDLIDEDIEIADVEVGENEYLYVFTFVGVVAVSGCVIKCYPKYLIETKEPKEELKQVLRVIERYNTKNQIIRMYNDNMESTAFNLLAVIMFLLQDYYEYGSYSNTEDIIESNGAGDILWDKTINETFTLLSNNRPYYPELLTRKRVNDEYDYFKRLHDCILTKCSKELEACDLTDLFDIDPVDLSDEELDDFGEKEYILYRIQNELNVQFNTRKQLVLKTMYAYIDHSSNLDDTDCFSLFGTNSFNLVWENVCAEILNNQLKTPLGSLKLPVPLLEKYDRTQALETLIDKPIWSDKDKNGVTFTREADTLIPDLISVGLTNGQSYFIIFDAKYYNMQLESNKPLRGQPGLESVTKQYLYQLAYQRFIQEHRFNIVKNCFLMPTQRDDFIPKGQVAMDMLGNLGLEPIQNRLIPAKKAYELYLHGQKLDISLLEL